MEKNQIQDILHHHFNFLNQEEIDHLLAIGKLYSYKNKESIIQEGELLRSMYFIVDGSVRGYYVEDSGEERTFFIRPKHTFFSGPEILQDIKTSKYCFEAIQETQLLKFPFKIFERLSQSHLGLSRLYIGLLKELVGTLIFRVEMLAGKSPEERYEILLDRHPEFFQQSNSKDIANYLGITPNSLSRIVKRRKESKS